MSRNFIYILIVNVAFLLAGCQEDDCCFIDPDTPIVGTWLLTERGYSPGSGYITDPVEPEPAQVMSIDTDGGFSSNIRGLEEFGYFRILEDSQSEVLALFRVPTSGDLDLDRLEHSYNIQFQDDGSVKLYFRFCFEGCHLGFKKMSQ